MMRSRIVTLLLLVSILPTNLRFEQHALWVVFGFDIKTRFFLCRAKSAVDPLQANNTQHWGTRATRFSDSSVEAYIDELAGTKPGASVMPVTLLQLVDLDAFPVVGYRHLQCHHRRMTACLASMSRTASAGDSRA
jgi:hypothetical protein